MKQIDITKIEKLSFDWTDETKYRVGSHQNCPVTMTRKNNGPFRFLDGTQIAHHVYASAFNYNGNVSRTQFTHMVSKNMLTSEYKAAIICAWDNSLKYTGRPGSNKLFLCMLGCGVFGNDPKEVSQYIASLKDLIIDSGLDVYVVAYTNQVFKRIESELLPIVKETKGTITEI
ncbi:hypothetical protein GPJ56_005043 [Histomonas meleagridis]|uniref:uncharacterized protein n=1 Tax=Histomonas meleagridis TaxID=135588 RepID=UPI00355984C2|nr:hypothetical protein GPJ56_005043 [Histomonas meleagridis]KAH0802560.1 hypothetical protein GO595_004609 [Histomonas meleagridis]